MERLTNEAIKVDASVDGMIGSFVDLANMKTKLLDVILNGPTLISVSKNVLRSIIRQLYSALAAYEDTGLEPEQCAEYGKADREGRYIVLRDAEQKGVKRLRELAKADKEGRLVVLPCKDWLDVVFGDQVLFWGIDRDYMEQPIREISVDDADRIGWYDGYKTVFLKGTDENGEAWEFYPEEIGKTVFLTREEAEAALKEVQNDTD